MMCNNSDQGCDWQGSVGTLDKHMATCEFECVPCKYQYVGCDVKMTRKDIAQHEEEDDKQHLHLALQSVAIPTLSDGEYLVFKMSEYSSKKRNKEVFLSEPFYTHSNGYKMRFKIHVSGTGSGEGTHVSVSSCLLKGPFDKSLQWPFLGIVLFQMLNQADEYNNFGMNLVYDDKEYAQPGGSWDIEKFISHSALSKKRWFMKNDSIFFRVAVKFSESLPWLECGKKVYPVLLNSRKTFVDKEPLVFKVDEYSIMKCNGESISSQHFFTSPRGYKMKVKIYPDGEGEGKGEYISVYIFILEGLYDRSLSWPFAGIMKLELLNQLSDEHHYSKDLIVLKEANIQVGDGRGFPCFIRHAKFQCEDNQFLVDDTFYFRVSVKVDSYKPWLTCTS